jgi:hypothetical protein
MATIITGNGVHMGNVGQGQKLLGKLRSGPISSSKESQVGNVGFDLAWRRIIFTEPVYR